MEILLLLIIVILSFIAYKLNQIEKAQFLLEKAETNSTTLSSSFNPLFSEKEIADCRSISGQWDEKVENRFVILQRTEKEEIEKHHSTGKDKSEFTPSDNLEGAILRFSVAIIGRNTMDTKARQMIEANIAILNGKSIDEVSEQFHKQPDCVPWNNIFLDENAWINTPTIKKEFEKSLAERSEFWQNSWDYILEKDYLTKE